MFSIIQVPVGPSFVFKSGNFLFLLKQFHLLSWKTSSVWASCQNQFKPERWRSNIYTLVVDICHSSWILNFSDNVFSVFCPDVLSCLAKYSMWPMLAKWVGLSSGCSTKNIKLKILAIIEFLIFLQKYVQKYTIYQSR